MSACVVPPLNASTCGLEGTPVILSYLSVTFQTRTLVDACKREESLVASCSPLGDVFLILQTFSPKRARTDIANTKKSEATKDPFPPSEEKRDLRERDHKLSPVVCLV